MKIPVPYHYLEEYKMRKKETEIVFATDKVNIEIPEFSKEDFNKIATFNNLRDVDYMFEKDNQIYMPLIWNVNRDENNIDDFLFNVKTIMNLGNKVHKYNNQDKINQVGYAYLCFSTSGGLVGQGFNQTTKFEKSIFLKQNSETNMELVYSNRDKMLNNIYQNNSIVLIDDRLYHIQPLALYHLGKKMSSDREVVLKKMMSTKYAWQNIEKMDYFFPKDFGHGVTGRSFSERKSFFKSVSFNSVQSGIFCKENEILFDDKEKYMDITKENHKIFLFNTLLREYKQNIEDNAKIILNSDELTYLYLESKRDIKNILDDNELDIGKYLIFTNKIKEFLSLLGQENVLNNKKITSITKNMEFIDNLNLDKEFKL